MSSVYHFLQPFLNSNEIVDFEMILDENPSSAFDDGEYFYARDDDKDKWRKTAGFIYKVLQVKLGKRVIKPEEFLKHRSGSVHITENKTRRLKNYVDGITIHGKTIPKRLQKDNYYYNYSIKDE